MNSRFKNPIVKIKDTDQIVNNSDTLVNDNTLVIDKIPAGDYHFQMFIMLLSTAVADIKLKLALTNTTGFYTANVASSVQDANNVATEITPGTDGTNETIVYYGKILVSSSPGTIQLQWAQNTAEATNTTVFAGSTLMLFRKTP